MMTKIVLGQSRSELEGFLAVCRLQHLLKCIVEMEDDDVCQRLD